MNLLTSANFVFHQILYQGMARHLPSSTMPGGTLWRKYRYWVCRPLFSYCGHNVNIERGASIGRRTVSIGSNSSIGINASVDAGTQIGDDVMMGPEVVILSWNHMTSRTDVPMIQQGFTACSPVTIENDVWIGRRVIILPGVTVGSGCVLGAGAVISRDVPPNAIAVGNPARVVRYRSSSANLTRNSNHGASVIST